LGNGAARAIVLTSRTGAPCHRRTIARLHALLGDTEKDDFESMELFTSQLLEARAAAKAHMLEREELRKYAYDLAKKGAAANLAANCRLDLAAAASSPPLLLSNHKWWFGRQPLTAPEGTQLSIVGDAATAHELPDFLHDQVRACRGSLRATSLTRPRAMYNVLFVPRDRGRALRARTLRTWRSLLRATLHHSRLLVRPVCTSCSTTRPAVVARRRTTVPSYSRDCVSCWLVVAPSTGCSTTVAG
jgi:hypothetical protein